MHAHDREVCHTFRLAPFRGDEVLMMSGNQLIDRDHDAPFPDDFELLDEAARTVPPLALESRLAINCPACDRGLTVSRNPDVVRRIVKTLARNERTEVDIESLRGYVVT
jgi:hypothetical protein